MGFFIYVFHYTRNKMKLTLKTLKQEELFVEVEPDQLISQLKEKIAEKYSHPAEAQRLIFAGKILDDAQTISSYNITEKDFLVMMVKKGVAPVKKPAPAAAPAPEPAPVSSPVVPSVAEPTVSAAEPTVSSPAQPDNNSGADDNSMVTGSEYEETIARIAEMGFDREQIVIALEASFKT